MKKITTSITPPIARVVPSSPRSHVEFFSDENRSRVHELISVPVKQVPSAKQIKAEIDSTWRDSTDVPSYKTLVDDKTASGELALDDNGHLFIKAPQSFYGKTLFVTVAGRTAEEKKANSAVAENFKESLDDFFGEEIANHLYPPQEREEHLAKGAPLTVEKARTLIEKGFEMIDAIAGYCEEHSADNPKTFVESLSPTDKAFGIARYAQEEANTAATAAEKQNPNEHVADGLSHSLGIVGGGLLAGAAVMATGHLSPSDCFFLADLICNKTLSKTVEHYIDQAILWRIGDNTESALTKSVLEDYGRAYIPSFVTSASLRTANLEVTEDSSSSAAHVIASAVGLGSGPEGLGLGTAHSRLFRTGVTSIVDSFKGWQQSYSHWSESSAVHDKAATTQATATAAHQHAVTLAQQLGTPVQLALAQELANQAPKVSIKKVEPTQQIKIPPWRRGT